MDAKFVVTKWEDLLELDSEDIDKFQEIQRKIENNRKTKGLSKIEYEVTEK